MIITKYKEMEIRPQNQPSFCGETICGKYCRVNYSFKKPYIK